MAVREIVLLGDPKLYEVSAPVRRSDLDRLGPVIQDLHDTLLNFRARRGAGRAIAAPQIGVMKRLVYMHLDRPLALINPALDDKSEAMIEIWDDCMSFPDLLVKVRRHQSCRLTFWDDAWIERRMGLSGDLAELIQHECDHLDGVLAVSRAVDARSFALKSQRPWLDLDSAGQQ